MSVLPVGFGSSGGSVDVGDVPASMRFRGAQDITVPAPASTVNTYTLFMWFKRTKFGAVECLAASRLGGVSSSDLVFDASDQLRLELYNAYYITTTGKYFRDPTAWLPITLSVTASGAINLWVADQLVGTATAPASSFMFNTSYTNKIGVLGDLAAQYSNSYKARICYVAGTALDYTSFLTYNSEINEWVSKDKTTIKGIVDAGGASSFMYDFNNGTSLTTLGYDYSAKGNNATLNNFSLTAGTTYDHMLDVPGNSFAVLNPLFRSAYPAALTGANLNLVGNSLGGYAYFKATLPAPTNVPIYWEATQVTVISAGRASSGMISESFADNQAGAWASAGMTGSYYGPSNTSFYSNGSATLTGQSPSASTAGQVQMHAYDPVTGKYWVGVNGTWWNSGNPASGTNPCVTLSTTTTWFPAAYHDSESTDAFSINFGQRPFAYTPPTGFLALCQENLPTPAILNPSSAVAHRFEAGSGIAAAIASDRSGWWSDWMEWFKRTDTTESWKVRFSDDSGNMMAFDTNGTKAAWSAPSTGTYLGTAFRVGATYGVVTGTYSGDSTSNKNISHSLGKAPTCGIVKNESTGTWYVWHTKMTSAAYFTTLNSATPPAQSNTNTPWGTGNWSSTQFMVTNNATNNLNATGSTYRYILFADIDGLLALLGHTGNASTDGAFEYAGHKAQLLVEKDLSATTGFYLWSDKIDTYNVTASYLLLNTNAGTAAATGVDVCSNGTKYRSATIANAANPHMGISYSRTPGKYSLGR